MAQPVSLADTVGLSVAEGLEYVIRKEVPHTLGTQLILRAGASGDSSYIPLLKQVVDSWGPDRLYEWQTVAALHCLWFLGEPTAYFLAGARNWEEDYMLAYQSAMILARTPTPEILAVLEEIHEEALHPRRSDYLSGALQRARNLAHRIEQFEQSSPRERADMVIYEISGWWSPWPPMDPGRLSEGSRVSIGYDNRDPYHVVVWGWFQRLIHEEPAAIAEAIRSVETERDGTVLTPEEARDLRCWLVEGTTPVVRAYLEDEGCTP